MDLQIAGRRAAVAASSGGLGLASAQALAAEGVRVAICGRGADRLADALALLPPVAAGDHVAIRIDVGTAVGGDAFVREAAEALGGLDILVANAGGPPTGTFATTPIEAYPKALELNLLSTVAMCQAAVPDLVAQGWGRVVAITSHSVRQPIPNLILSNTARAGVTGFLKTLSTEVARHGVTVNSVQPGIHETDRFVELHEGDTSGAARSVPTHTIGRPADFGAVVAFLCSDQARYVTGTAIPVDGGATLGLQ
jgi:3-oxoacyl-[acyl-carrier protein] reductase